MTRHPQTSDKVDIPSTKQGILHPSYRGGFASRLGHAPPVTPKQSFISPYLNDIDIAPATNPPPHLLLGHQKQVIYLGATIVKDENTQDILIYQGHDIIAIIKNGWIYWTRVKDVDRYDKKNKLRGIYRPEQAGH